MDDAAGALPVIAVVADLIHLAVVLASRIKLAGLALAVLVVVVLVVAFRRWRYDRKSKRNDDT